MLSKIRRGGRLSKYERVGARIGAVPRDRLPPTPQSFLRRQVADAPRREPIPLEGAPPRRAGTSLPRRGGSQTVLTSAKTHHPPLPHQAMSPKSDTNPLTKAKHLYYIHPRLASHSPKPKEEPKHRGNHSPGPEDSTSQPIPKGGPRAAPRLKRKPPSPHIKGPGSPSPATQAMEDPQTILGRPRPTTPLPIQRPPSSGAFTPAHCAPVSRQVNRPPV